MSEAPRNGSTEAAPLPRLLDAKAAAAALRVGRTQLWTLTTAGKLASVRIGRRVFYDQRDLADFIDRNRRERRA